jgi:queuine tRNA-ribosyltransferase
MQFFQSECTDGEARVGRLHFSGFSVETPCFMPVGTRASVKGLWQEDIEEIGYKLILANTYHLYLRPGSEDIRLQGGLARFMSWNGAILTDSGGYQMFSLADRMKLDDSGVDFKSHLDGSSHRFTPEVALSVQADLGSSIAMVLDDCPPGDADRSRVQAALDRTHRWAARSIDAWKRLGAEGRVHPETQRIFGIVQGGVFEDARAASLEAISTLPFDGIAIGGLSVGESREDFFRIVDFLSGRMDPARPRYLMGVGTIPDFLAAVQSGVDMFDCVLPTRNARNGQGLTHGGRVRIRQNRYRTDTGPLDAECSCRVCRRYSRAYLRHLFMSDEMLGPELMSYHNLAFYFRFFEEMRAAIREKKYRDFCRRWASWEKMDVAD